MPLFLHFYKRFLLSNIVSVDVCVSLSVCSRFIRRTAIASSRKPSRLLACLWL